MDLPDPTDRRDRLAAALLAIDPELALLRWDAEAVIFIHVREERVVHLITTPPDLPQELVLTRPVQDLLRRSQRNPKGQQPEAARALAFQGAGTRHRTAAGAGIRRGHRKGTAGSSRPDYAAPSAARRWRISASTSSGLSTVSATADRTSCR